MSIRSFVGVASFMFSGVLFASTFPVTNSHLRDTPDTLGQYTPTLVTNIIVTSIISVVAVFALVGLVRDRTSSGDATDKVVYNRPLYLAATVMASIFFAVGLVVSQMTLYSKIFGFLNVALIPSGTWDPTLIMVMGGGFIVSFLSYQWVKGFNMFKNSHAMECPLTQKNSAGKFNLPTNKIIDFKLILGEAIFGLGWGMAGLCPGPAMVLGASGYPNILYRWWPMFFVGSFLAEKLKALLPQNSVGKQEEEVVSSHDNTKSNKIEATEKTFQCQDIDAGDKEAVGDDTV